MTSNIYNDFIDSPIVAAVKDFDGLTRAIHSECKMIFILFGDICNIGEIVKQIKDHGKKAFVHIDLIDGLSTKDIAVSFIKNNTNADGIISTHSNIIKSAKEQGLITVQRFFLIDSIALENVKKHIQLKNADIIEILPGVMPKVITKIAAITQIPLIAGGLISDKIDIMSAISAGAAAVSTTNSELWFL